MQTRHKSNRLTARIVNVWQKRGPYAITRKASLVGGSVSAIIALGMAAYGSGIEGLVLYGFISMFFFMWWYAITHL